MQEEQLTRLRNRLRRKQERLEAMRGGFFPAALGRFWKFLKAEPFLVPILEELRGNQRGRSAAHRMAVMVGTDSQYDPRIRQALDSIETEEEMAALAYHLIRGGCEEDWNLIQINKHVWGDNPGNTSDFLTFKPEVVGSLCEYLEGRLDEQQAILGLLVRYKKRCEWFNRKELLKMALDEQALKGS